MTGVEHRTFCRFCISVCGLRIKDSIHRRGEDISSLPHFAVPRYVRVLDELPRNIAARVEKYKLRADGVTPDTWDREAAGYLLRRV